jgi:hypothetical protein
MSLFDLYADPALRAHLERSRIAEKVEAVARERRSGVSGIDRIEEAAAEDLARWAARRPTTASVDDIEDVSMADVDVDVVGAAGFADERRRRLDAAIQDRMTAA